MTSARSDEGIPHLRAPDWCLLEQMIEVFPGNLFTLDGQMCQGFFTGDDFCDVSCRVRVPKSPPKWSLTDCFVSFRVFRAFSEHVRTILNMLVT